jgi:hypothetical protein
MSRLAAAFGKSYESAVAQIRTKTFFIGGHEFKVRIPLTAEMTALQARITQVDPEKARAKFDEMTKGLRVNPPAGVEITEDDVIIEGKSTKELVNAVLMMENRVIEYIRLLIPVKGTLDDITYDEIEAEWPLAVQMEIVEKISDAIQPGYKDARKNS